MAYTPHGKLGACSCQPGFPHNNFALLASDSCLWTDTLKIVWAWYYPTCTLLWSTHSFKLILFRNLTISLNNTLCSNYPGSSLGIQTLKAMTEAPKCSFSTYFLSNLSCFKLQLQANCTQCLKCLLPQRSITLYIICNMLPHAIVW